MPDLVPPKHLWHFGLREPQGRTFESISVPLLFDNSFKRFVLDAQSFLGPEYTKVPVDTAHVTLGGMENRQVPWNPPIFRAGFVHVEDVLLSEYSIRLVLEQAPFAELAQMFGVPKATRPYGLTLAYAGATIPEMKAQETLGQIKRAFLGARPLRLGFEFVERQRRPRPTRAPFQYERIAFQRGIAPTTTT